MCELIVAIILEIFSLLLFSSLPATKPVKIYHYYDPQFAFVLRLNH